MKIEKQNLIFLMIVFILLKIIGKCFVFIKNIKYNLKKAFSNFSKNWFVFGVVHN